MNTMYESSYITTTLDRIESLSASTKPLWGKMTVGQMLAHCCVAYDMVHTDRYPKATGLKRFMLKLFVKNAVVGPKPYPKNGRTAPEFIVNDERDFETEKVRLIDNIKKNQSLGTTYFDGKESTSFGPLTTQEWDVLFTKHLDHHLKQFGV